MTFRDELKRLHLGQRQYARLIGADPRYIRRLANGRVYAPQAIVTSLERSSPDHIVMPVWDGEQTLHKDTEQ